MRDFDYENDQWVKLPSHLKHLPLFTRHLDLFSFFIRIIWSIILKGWFFSLYLRLKVHGSFDDLYRKHPKLLLISNHSSHLDATSIAAAVPFKYWKDLFITAAQDYFFSNPLFTFFSQHCLGAIPVNRQDKKSETVRLIQLLLKQLDRIWLILFPEGTRSPDGKIQTFKKGVALFSQSADVPILFLYIKGAHDRWPKGQVFATPGPLEIFIGPVIPPGLSAEEIEKKYREWATSLENNPSPRGEI